MQIKFSIKQLGKKRAFIDSQSIEIAGNYGQYTLKEILSRIVSQQVETFNQKRTEKSLFNFLQETDIQAQAENGRVRFGAVYNETQADVEKAIETVLLAFEDGLIAVFVDDEQIDLISQNIAINPNTTFTFVRLTFLAGSVW
ncbi:MAG: hypothetical protein MUE85_09425 [Microscillaceae bacterium]|jgi:uncharacterized protein YjgD (DUF1641 family)|nr:hypothetical protein [Microscillaceae bacterium]